jgi:hypothetical protein
MRRWLLTPLVASLFVLSFVESWAALLDAARAAGIPYPKPWPWMVDGFILATALMVVAARATGHGSGAWWPRLGLLGATALSTGIQATWAPQADWAWALHAWSPLAVLSSFECLVWLVFAAGPARPERASVQPVPTRLHAWLRSWNLPDPPVPAIPVGPPAGSPGHTPTPGPVPIPYAPAPRARGRTPIGLTPGQRAKVAAWRAEVPPRSARWIASELGLSNHARSKHLAPLIEELARAGSPVGNGSRP